MKKVKRVSADSNFFDPISALRKEFYDGKRRFIDDLRGQIEDDPKIADLIKRRIKVDGVYVTKGSRLALVSFDRRTNDNSFSYGYFDIMLVLLDALSGGQGIFKPLNQLRVLHWNGFRRDLLSVILYFAKNNPQINARRILILPYPQTTVGSRLDTDIYQK